MKFKQDIGKKKDKLLCSKDDLLPIMEKITKESASNYNKLTDACVRSALKKSCDEKAMLKESTC